MTFIHIWVIKSNMYSKAVILIRNAMLVSFWSLKFYKMLTRDVTQLLAIWKIYPFFLVPRKCTQWNYIANDDDSLKRHLWNTHWRKATPLSAMRVYLNIETTSSNLRKHMMRKHVGEKPLTSTNTLPLSLMHRKFTWWRTLARSLYVLLKVWPMW